MYSKTLRRIIAASLCFSVIIVNCSCKKEKKNADNAILSSDPFFNSDMHELKLPVNESKKLANIYVKSIDYLGEQISIQYDILYNESKDPADYSMTQEQGSAVFDLEGNLLSKNSEETSATGSTYTTNDKDGNTITLYCEYNVETRAYQTYCIYQNASGEEVKRVDFENLPGASALVFEHLLLLPDNRYILRAYDEIGYCFNVYNESGKYLFKIQSLDYAAMSDIFLQDGKCYMLTSRRGDWQATMISEIDMENGNIPKGTELKQFLNPQTIVAGEDGLYNCTPNGISKYDIKSNEMKEILNWNQTDVDHGLMNEVKCFPKNENEVHAVATVYDSNYTFEAMYVINLQRAKSNPHAGKQILLAGGIYIPRNFYQFVQKYNSDKSHPARIETIDYSYLEGAGESGYNSIQNKIYLDVVGGTGPDILINFSAYAQFAQSGLLVDLNPYIDGKNGLNRSEYFDNLFRALESDGKLFFAPLTFMLNGVMVNTDLMDVDRTLTFDELDEAASKLPSGSSVFPKTEYTSLLDFFITQSLTEYVDYAKKEVHFNSDSMVRSLEEAKKYGCPKEEAAAPGATRYFALGDEYKNVNAYNPLEGAETKSVEDLFYLKQCAMIDVKIPSTYEYAYYQGLVDGNGRLAGYPSVDGKGVVAAPRFSLAIVNTCSHPEEAWDIVKSFYSKEAQELLTQINDWTGSSFPIRISTFEEEATDAHEKINAAREKFKENQSKSAFHASLVYFPVKENLVDELKELISGITCTSLSDSTIIDIINEESNGYFLGARSAEDVLNIIDKRAKQVIQES
ncbi:MAG: extracellular solute-binding protein [Clostridiales bacterium]|nr:extracellular solute-binding protein [Clostridiales bacterium]